MISTTLIIFIISLFDISIGVDPDDLVVRLNQPNGRIRGHTLKSAKGNTFFAFQEIPYAAPPVGDKRFKAPEPHAGWDGILNTTQNTKSCIQFGGSKPANLSENADEEIEQSEDCLVLNVFTPVAPGSEEKLPVYLWIYGGAFSGGSIHRFDPQYLIDGGIVIVMMNYRLGPLGFLSTEDDVVHGNMGLKDQHFALQWTYQNIELFGGNPNDIVVDGQSAGAASSSYQLLSPRNKGLISAVIQRSAGALGDIGYEPQPRKSAFALARNLNLSVSSDDTTSLIESLRKVPIEELKAAAVQSPNSTGSVMSWIPVVELENDQSFITTFMHQDFMDGNFNRVPTMVGFNSEESVFFLSVPDDLKRAAQIDADPSLMISQKMNVENRTLAGQRMKNAYTSASFTDDLGAYVRFNSDSMFTRSVTRQAKLTSQYVPVYLYQFSAGPSVYPDFPGMGHSGEQKYFWGAAYETNQFNGGEIKTNETIREIMLTLWWNFIKYKNPTPENIPILQNITWPTVQPDDMKYLNINYTLVVQADPRNCSRVEEILLDQMLPPYIVF